MEAAWCLTLQVLSNAQSQAIFGPLNNTRVVEDNAGQDHPLAPHHRLVCRLLREPRRPRRMSWRELWEKIQKKELKVKEFLLRHDNTIAIATTELPPPSAAGAY